MGDEGATSGQGGTESGAGSGGAGAVTPSVPSRVFVGGRWLTAEELASDRAQVERENSELRGRLAALEERQKAPETTSLPSWAADMLDKGVPEATVRVLLQASSGGSPDVRELVRDELSKIAQQAQKSMSAADIAKLKYIEDNPEFDEGTMSQILASDPMVKDGYDTFWQGGKHYQALDYVWKSRLAQGRTVNQRGRAQADVPQARRLVREREEAAGVGSDEGPRRPKIPQEVLDAAAVGGEDAVREYMRHRRKGNALDLDAEPPPGWRSR